MKKHNLSLYPAAAALLFCAGHASAQQTVFIGALHDTTGVTAQVGREFADAKTDAVKWINENGGVNGKKIEMDAVDYAYKAPNAVGTYKKWMSGSRKPVAILGYGTADTEALVGFVNTDKIIYFSQANPASLTDPAGASKRVDKPTPYNFFHGPSYSDACRAELKYFNDQWKTQAKTGKPKFAFMGDNHPFANSHRETCQAYATEIGYDVVPAIQYSMRPGDYKAQCLTLKESAADIAYLGNTGDSNISVLKSCETVGVKAKFFTNVWGYSELVLEAAGQAAAGVIAPFPVAPWGMNSAAGAKTISAIAGGKPRTSYYIAAVCSVFYVKEALEWADKNGGITGEKVRQGMYQKKDWVPKGLEGQCAPATWTASDHRSMTSATLWEGQLRDGKPAWKYIGDVAMPREEKWFGR